MYNLRKYSDKQINNRLKKDFKKTYQIKYFLVVLGPNFLYIIYMLLFLTMAYKTNKIFFKIFPLFPKKPLTYIYFTAIIRVHKHRDLN